MRLGDWQLGLGNKSSRLMRRRLRMEQSEYRSYRAIHPFDERFGVDTSGLIYDLPTGSRHDDSNYGYFGVAPSIFHKTLEKLRLDYRQFRFVDLGSGKGRALLLASGYPFREVIGVELSPRLHRVARANIARYARCEIAAPATSIQADAAEFRWPEGPLLVYMWNAFAWPVMEQVLKNLRAAFSENPREIYLVYIHPEFEDRLDYQLWMERLWSVEIEMSDEDYSAWAFPSRAERCTAYRATGYGA